MAAAPTKSPRVRNWCFTLNNPSGLLDDEYEANTSLIAYICYGEEIGDSGTPHFQGYVEFTKKVTLKVCKELLPTAHWEPRYGTQAQAIAYCKKEGDPFLFHERGTLKVQGKRTDIQDLYKDALTLMSLKDLQDKHPAPYMRMHRAVDRVRFNATVGMRRSRVPTVVVLYGETGCGKTHYCEEIAPDAFYLEAPSSSNGTLWWDGYDFQDTVVFDEFSGWVKFTKLLRMLHQGNCKIETKGGTMALMATNFLFTSNYHPSTWYPNVSNWNSFLRRVTTWSYWFMEDGLRKHSNFNDYDDFCAFAIQIEGPPKTDNNNRPKYCPPDGCTRLE